MRKHFILTAGCFISTSFMTAASLPIAIPVANKCIEAYKRGNYSSASSFLQQLSPRDSCSARSPTSESTLLHYASGRLRVNDVEELLNKYDGESKIEWKNKHGETPLYYAARSYVEAMNDYGYNDKQYQGLSDIFEKILVKYPLLVNEKNNSGQTVLHMLVQCNVKHDIFSLLKKYHVDFNICDNKQRTSLHHACYTKNKSFITFIKNNKDINFDIKAIDSKGKMAIEYAFPFSGEFLESCIWLREQESKL